MMPGFWQVILVLLIVLILFGAGKLPRVMGDIAKGVRSFRAGLKDDDDEKDEAQPKVLKSETPPKAETVERTDTPDHTRKEDTVRT